MSRKYRISSPKIFEPVLTKSKTFREHDWLFDVNPGIVTGFQPDVRISFNSNAAFTNNDFGHVAKLNRQLVAHSNFTASGEDLSLSQLEIYTYVTMTHEDEAFLTMTSSEGSETPLRPAHIFRASDVLAAELAVKLNIGYSALPEFLLAGQISNNGTYKPLLIGGQVSPTYLRIESSGPPDLDLGEIHGTIFSSLAPIVDAPWRPFGHTQNIVSMVGSE